MREARLSAVAAAGKATPAAPERGSEVDRVLTQCVPPRREKQQAAATNLIKSAIRLVKLLSSHPPSQPSQPRHLRLQGRTESKHSISYNSISLELTVVAKNALDPDSELAALMVVLVPALLLWGCVVESN